MLIAKTSAEWEAFLAPLDVMCEPVRAPEGVLQSEPQVYTHALFLFQRNEFNPSSQKALQRIICVILRSKIGSSMRDITV